MSEHAPRPRTYTAQEIADLGEALSPHIELAVQRGIQPLQDQFNALKSRASFWGAVGGALPGLSALIVGLWRGGK